MSPGKWNEVLPGLWGIEERSAVLGVETGTVDVDEMSGAWIRWNEGEGYWAPGGHYVVSPGQ